MTPFLSMLQWINTETMNACSYVSNSTTLNVLVSADTFWSTKGGTNGKLYSKLDSAICNDYFYSLKTSDAFMRQ